MNMRFNLGFTLIELIIVMSIAAILAGLGFSGYIDSIRVQRRQDAVLSLQKAYLAINNSTTTVTTSSCSSSAPIGTCSTPCSYNSVSLPCSSTNGFYCINYCIPSTPGNGFSSSNIQATDKQYLIATESLILQASAITGKGQDNDTASCQNIYLSDQNNIYPSSCGK